MIRALSVRLLSLTLGNHFTDDGTVGGVLTMESYEKDFNYTDATTVSAVMVSLQNVGAFRKFLAYNLVVRYRLIIC